MSHSTYDDRRDSPRFPSRLFVRGLGADRETIDRLGDLSIGGVGFTLPHCPHTGIYRVSFMCPGESRLRTGVVEVLDATPLPGSLDRESPFFVHLRFRDLKVTDQLALARSIERKMRVPEYEFEIEEDEHSMLPVKRSELPLPSLPLGRVIAPEPTLRPIPVPAYRPLVPQIAPRAGFFERVRRRFAA